MEGKQIKEVTSSCHNVLPPCSFPVKYVVSPKTQLLRPLHSAIAWGSKHMAGCAATSVESRGLGRTSLGTLPVSTCVPDARSESETGRDGRT